MSVTDGVSAKMSTGLFFHLSHISEKCCNVNRNHYPQCVNIQVDCAFSTEEYSGHKIRWKSGIRRRRKKE